MVVVFLILPPLLFCKAAAGFLPESGFANALDLEISV